MHNLHFITINAISAKQACEKVEHQFKSEKEELDFSKLDVNPDDFYNDEDSYKYSKFKKSMMRTDEHLYDELKRLRRI